NFLCTPQGTKLHKRAVERRSVARLMIRLDCSTTLRGLGGQFWKLLYPIPPPLPTLPPPCSIKGFEAFPGGFMATDTISAPMLGDMPKTRIFKNFIDGEWVESSTGETFEDRNPADTRDVVGIFQKSGKADVDAAIEA